MGRSAQLLGRPDLNNSRRNERRMDEEEKQRSGYAPAENADEDEE